MRLENILGQLLKRKLIINNKIQKGNVNIKDYEELEDIEKMLKSIDKSKYKIEYRY